MKNPKKILIIIQRSNGDVFLSMPLINSLYENYHSPQIDLLVNDDTIAVAELLPHIHYIHQFSYQKKQERRFRQEKELIFSVYRKYDLSINLTASDRSVFYALLASKKSISAIEKNHQKSWWKRKLLSHYYFFDTTKHILINNLESLKILNIKHQAIQRSPRVSNETTIRIKNKLENMGVNRFIIFHPSAQYNYKIYPKNLRDKLLGYLNSLNVPILITGSSNKLDLNIKKAIPALPNIYNFIGETTLEEYFVLSELALAYIGMDTLNMHIAAAQNKRIFTIFGPTNLSMWSPWSNELQTAASKDIPVQTYGNISIFQANMHCVACGKAGCDDMHGISICLDNINPKDIFSEVQNWFQNERHDTAIEIITNTEDYARNIVLYIVYGEEKSFYDGAKLSFLTFLNWKSEKDAFEIVILTEKPEEFNGYPVKVLPISVEQKKDWSLNGKYHFRIKNRGIAYIMDKLDLKGRDKLLFLDTDTYFNKSPLPLFHLIKPNQTLFYLNEGLIYGRKRFDVYVRSLKGKQIEFDGHSYQLSKKSAMWGALMLGLMANMRLSLEFADKLMLRFIDQVPAHTVEQFALSEILLAKYKIVEGKKFVSSYSTSRKKEYANKMINKFFKENNKLPVNKQITLAQKIRIKRPITIVLKQRFFRLFKK